MRRCFSLHRLLPVILALGLLAACGTPEPTQMPSPSPDVAATDAVATATAAALLEAVRPTLPPTWTPVSPGEAAEQPSAVVTQEPGPAAASALDRLVFAADGQLWAVGVDGSGLMALTEPVNARDLAVSPDGQYIAFVADAAGGGRDVFAVETATNTILQASALGLADVVDPAWHPNLPVIVFAAGPQGGGRDLYTVQPNGLNLERRTQLDQPGLSDPAFSPDGLMLVFAAPGVTLLDLATGTVTPYTQPGQDHDLQPRFRPGGTEIIYIRQIPSATGYGGGRLHSFDPATFQPVAVPPILIDFFAQAFAFSQDGDLIVFSSDFSVYLFDFTTRSTRQVGDAGSLLTRFALSPDGTRVAYLAGGRSATTGQPVSEEGQALLIVTDRAGRDQQTVLTVTAQTVTDLVWVGGG
ncbi:MAG: PD40 domain-containing protein [Anaerolineae bacterium]|nr:PD40 domain-containing protein [Anaerolineae bacterium]